MHTQRARHAGGISEDYTPPAIAIEAQKSQPQQHVVCVVSIANPASALQVDSDARMAGALQGAELLVGAHRLVTDAENERRSRAEVSRLLQENNGAAVTSDASHNAPGIPHLESETNRNWSSKLCGALSCFNCCRR